MNTEGVISLVKLGAKSRPVSSSCCPALTSSDALVGVKFSAKSAGGQRLTHLGQNAPRWREGRRSIAVFQSPRNAHDTWPSFARHVAPTFPADLRLTRGVLVLSLGALLR